jgi:rhamnogalacturonan endolyase
MMRYRQPASFRCLPRILLSLSLSTNIGCRLSEPVGPSGPISERAKAVKLTESADKITIGNGLVELSLGNRGGLNELHTHGGPNLASRGYWNFFGNGFDSAGNKEKGRFAVLEGNPKVIRSSDELVEIAFTRKPSSPMFFTASLHYVLRRGEPGFYIYMTASDTGTERSGHPTGYITQYAYNLRLDGNHFDTIAVDDERRHISHSCREEAEATKIMDATFRLPDGRVVSKYNYCHEIEDGEFHLYGWAGPKTGVWWIQPSGEYYGSTPFRRLLTSHQTAKSPIIVWQAHCTHRGGTEIVPNRSTTKWKKLYGPAFVYINQGTDKDNLWKDAKTQVEAMSKEWPYRWMTHELYPTNRGLVSGRLKFEDGTPARNAWVILSPEGTHWSKENLGYHFWSKTDQKGRFHIKDVRAGHYSLYTAGADQFYEFQHDGVEVSSGEETQLKKLTWKRIRNGKQIWQIGTADRSTGEFANGDDFHHWGLWRRYPNDFPNDVRFIIGKSQERKDWNFVHWNWHSKKNAWEIVFELNAPPEGNAVLTVGIAAARGHKKGLGSNRTPAQVQVAANGKEVGTIIVESTGGDIYRSARQSTRYNVREIRLDAALLRRGVNSISFSHSSSEPYKVGDEKGEAGSGPGGILYDAIRFEITD